jgi:hypothetical protein
MRSLTSGFFHQSNPPGPLIHILKYFWIQFWIRRDIRIQSLTGRCGKSPLSAIYYSSQSKLAAKYVVASQVAMLFIKKSKLAAEYVAASQIAL